MVGRVPDKIVLWNLSIRWSIPMALGSYLTSIRVDDENDFINKEIQES